jgi:uncharacterized protein (TIGR02246 family)
MRDSMKRLSLILGLAALVGAGLSAQAKKAPPAGGGDDAAIAKIRTAFQTAVMGQDAAGIARLFAADGAELPPNSPAVMGRAAIEKYHKDFAQQFMVHGISITSLKVQVAGDIAYDVGTYKQQLMAMKGGAVMDDHGKYVVLLKKEGGNWVVTHSIYNSDLPPPAPPSVKK